ncbi:MAG: hypothetical protein Q9188_005405 [Gyalolechia gomerana]
MPRPCTTGYQPNLLLEYRRGGSACQNRRSPISHNNLEWSNPSISTASPDILPSHTSSSTRSSITDVDDHRNTHSANPSNSDFNRNAESSDCTLLATEVLQSLATATTQSLPQQTPISSFSFSNPKVNSPNFDTQLEVASTAIKRLSSILICPCSENPHAGLLCIAVCTAILDVFWDILQSCIHSTIPSSASGMNDTTTNGRCNGINGPTSSISLIQDMISTFNHQQSDNVSQSKRFNQQVVVRRILEELPKAANVVMQLTQRYKTTTSPHNGHDEVAFLLPTLAIEQRGKLKAIVQKATGLLGTY